MRLVLGIAILLSATALTATADDKQPAGGPAKILRFQHGETIAYGRITGNEVRALSGAFGDWKPTDKVFNLKDVKVLVPVDNPSKVIALAGNYRDHLGDQPVPEFPQPFYKVPSCLVATGANIVLPDTTEDIHYEAEVVIVIGKRAKNVSEEDALKYVLGITCGNDISARLWQKNDRQWWRAKGADTFGPVGPYIATGIDYGNLDMVLRVNGDVRQKTNTANMIHNIAHTVSFISQHVTLEPGDLIYSGTPGKTQPLVDGDVVEVEIQNVGVLSNKVVGGTKESKIKEHLRRSIPLAASLSGSEFSKLASSETVPSLKSLSNQPLSLLLFALSPAEGEQAAAEYRYLDKSPKPSEIAAEIYRQLRGRGAQPPYATFIHLDRITAYECALEGDKATGSVSFEVPSLYAGKVEFSARKKGDEWIIHEFRLPAYHSKTVRGDDGQWSAAIPDNKQR